MQARRPSLPPAFTGRDLPWARALLFCCPLHFRTPERITYRDMKYAFRTAAFILLIGAALSFSACDSFTDGYDQSPNAATEAPADLIFNGAATTTIMFHEGNLARFASIFTNQATGSDRQYARVNRYDISASDIDSDWSTAYADVLGDLDVAKQQARSGGQTVLVNFSRILEAHTFGQLAALFGDIPVNGAFEGRENLNPEFLSQSDAYAQIQDSLTAAINGLEAYQDDPDAVGLDLEFGDTGLDIYYAGDVDSWINLGYALKARYYLHTGEYGAALGALDDIDGSFTDFIAPHQGSFNNNSNLWYSFIEIYRGGYLTANNAVAPALLDSTGTQFRGGEDNTRFEFYYRGSSPATYEFNTGGAFGFTADYPFLRDAELELIRAEAILKSGGANQDALAALNAARTLNAAYYGATLDEYDLSDFQAGGDFSDVPSGVTQSVENALLTEILEEKYLSNIGQLEAFNDFRRTDNFLQIALKQGESTPVGRFPYASIETQANTSAPEQPSVTSETPVNAALDYGPIN
jgi:starch-binding outer membrane protein, SusD/RagB family